MSCELLDYEQQTCQRREMREKEPGHMGPGGRKRSQSALRSWSIMWAVVVNMEITRLGL